MREHLERLNCSPRETVWTEAEHRCGSALENGRARSASASVPESDLSRGGHIWRRQGEAGATNLYVVNKAKMCQSFRTATPLAGVWVACWAELLRLFRPFHPWLRLHPAQCSRFCACHPF